MMTGKEEQYNLHCVPDGQKDGRDKSEMFQEIPVKCNSGSEASRWEHPFAEWREESRESNFHFFLIRKLSAMILSSTKRRPGCNV